MKKGRINLKKRFKRKNSLAMPQDEAGVAGLIGKMQRQLNAMEEKLDILISQSSKRPFEKSYSRPSRSFDSSERTFTRVICADCSKECEIPFKPSTDRPVYCRECFPKHKKDNVPGKRPAGKRHAGKRQKFAKKKKPFFEPYRKKRS
jgi:CxxC-x17-CxxC domain-containing protein